MELNKLYSYEKLTAFIKDTATVFAPLTALEYIGTSKEKHDIYAIHVGKGNNTFVFTAGLHGCENINPNVLICIAEYYAKNKLVKDDWRMIFVPLVNPDGYEIARLNKNNFRFNASNIDLNRNFPCKSYVGDSPASEPETQCLINLFKNYTPLLLVDFHSRGKSVFYHRSAMDCEYNRKNLRIAEAVCRETGYVLEVPEHENPNGIGGNVVQYFSETYKRPAITVETLLENEKYPLNENLQSETFKEIVNVPLIAAKEALQVL